MFISICIILLTILRYLVRARDFRPCVRVVYRAERSNSVNDSRPERSKSGRDASLRWNSPTGGFCVRSAFDGALRGRLRRCVGTWTSPAEIEARSKRHRPWAKSRLRFRRLRLAAIVAKPKWLKQEGEPVEGGRVVGRGRIGEGGPRNKRGHARNPPLLTKAIPSRPGGVDACRAGGSGVGWRGSSSHTSLNPACPARSAAAAMHMRTEPN